MAAYRENLNPTAPAAPAAGGPVLPTYGLDTLQQQDMGNVNQLFDPNFGRTETLSRAAENAVGGGFSGSGFGGNQAMKLLDSERRQNFVTGHQILEPYSQRGFEGAENEANRAARLNEIAAQGAQALQQLQLSEAGQTSRLSAELAQRLQQQVIEGQQAMQRLQLTEAGATSRQRTGIEGDLANTILQSALRQPTSGTSTARAPIPYTHYEGGVRLGTYGDTPTPAPVSGGGSSGGGILNTSSIDRILRQYGLTA